MSASSSNPVTASPSDGSGSSGRPPVWILALGGLFALFVVGMILTTLDRPDPPEFTPTDFSTLAEPTDVVRDTAVTVDARHPEDWVYFSFSRIGTLDSPRGEEWDLAMRRFRMVVNGGEGYPGGAGVVDLGRVPFDAVTEVPADGYEGTVRDRGDPVAPALEDWYEYSFLSHLLSPRNRTYAVRTADGGYVKIRFLGYYCPDAEPGCITFRYSYRGDGERRFDGPD